MSTKMEDELEEKVKLENGKTIIMKLSEDLDEITFWEKGEQLKGEFEFIVDEFDDDLFLLSRMYSPCPRQGLGEKALRFFKECTNDAVIYTRSNDGVVRDDGSHLTENAPPFVIKMQKLGLIAPWDDYDSEY